MIKRKDCFYMFFIYTFLILAKNPVSPNPKQQSRDLAAVDHFKNMLSSIIKINEKRVRSIKTLINLDDLYKAKSALRNGATNIHLREPKKKSKLIAVIIGDNKNIDRKLKQGLSIINLLQYENIEGSKSPVCNGEEMWSPTRRYFASEDSSTENCRDSEENKCHIISKEKSSKDNNRTCRRACRRGCRKACSSAFKNFCLTYACDYSMKAKIEKNCKRSCLYKFREKD